MTDHKFQFSARFKDKKIFKRFSPESFHKRKSSSYVRENKKNDMKVEDFFIDQQKVILRENLENFFANPQKDCSDCFDKYKKLFQKKELHEFLTQIILDENKETGIDKNSNLLRVEIIENVLEFDFDMEDLEKIFSTFGKIDRIILKRKGIAYITYDDILSCYFAQKTMNNFIIPNSELKIKVQICVIEDEDFKLKKNMFELPDEEIFKMFVIPYSENFEDNKLYSDKKYIYFTKFILEIENLNFRLIDRILGIKACNFLRIYYMCNKSNNIFDQEKQEIELKIYISNKKETENTIYIFGNNLDKFNLAVRLIHELLANIVEEYKKFCEIRGINYKSDVHIRKIEKFLMEPTLQFIENKND